MPKSSSKIVWVSAVSYTHLDVYKRQIPNLRYALDTHYPWQSDEIVVGGRLKFEEGSVTVPNGPGLGVELDKVALAKLHENYLKCGLTKRDDEIEMQKVVPGWKFMATRW